MAITEVQRATNADDTAGGTSFISSIDVTFSSPPIEDNALIICIIDKNASTPSITSVMFSNTSWTQAVNMSNGSNADLYTTILYIYGDI